MHRSILLLLRGTVVPIVALIIWEACARGLVLPSDSAGAIRRGGQMVGVSRPHGAIRPSQDHVVTLAVVGRAVARCDVEPLPRHRGIRSRRGLALPLGLVMGAKQRIYDLLNPLLQVLRPIPPIAYIPLAILWFGLGDPPSVFLIGLGAFFPVLMNTVAGVRHVDGIYLRAARNLGAKAPTIFTRVILPAATPYILGIGTAFIVVIVSEMIAVNDGLGYRILEAREFMWSDKIIAGMMTIGLLGLAIDVGMNRLNNHLLRWHRGLEN